MTTATLRKCHICNRIRPVAEVDKMELEEGPNGMSQTVFVCKHCQEVAGQAGVLKEEVR